MLIAVLVLLGVDLIVLLVLAVIAVARRRWLKRQSGQFVGAIRVTEGESHGLRTKWKRGSGRWVRDVFVWNKAPFMLRSELIPVDSFLRERQANAGEVKRLGDAPGIIGLITSAATIEIAARPEDRDLALGPFTTPSNTHGERPVTA
jgi:Protein of unknown function (DUF2550)